MEHTKDSCSSCGGPARVRILETYTAGKPVIRFFCFQCADRYYGEAAREEIVPAHRASLGSLMIVAGLTMGLIALLGDYVGIQGHPGFGWYKQLGLVLGVLLVCLGAFWRIDVIGVVGAILIALVFSAKLMHLAGTGGFGWKHQVALGLGLLLIVSGVVVRYLYHRRLALRTPTPPMDSA